MSLRKVGQLTRANRADVSAAHLEVGRAHFGPPSAKVDLGSGTVHHALTCMGNANQHGTSRKLCAGHTGSVRQKVPMEKHHYRVNVMVESGNNGYLSFRIYWPISFVQQRQPCFPFEVEYEYTYQPRSVVIYSNIVSVV